MNESLARELTAVRPDGGKVLSLYLDLDPSGFATAEARASAVTSLTDEAGRLIESGDRPHEELVSLRSDLEQARDYFASADYADGARAVAVFACEPAGLFRAERLGHPVETRAYVDEGAHVEPLLQAEGETDWGVLLVDRREVRLLRGGPTGLREESRFSGDDHRDSHTHGYLSEELKAHLERTSEAIRVAHRHRPLAVLLLGGQRELLGEVEERLPSEVRELVAGRIQVDVMAPPDEVLDAARPAMEEHEGRRLDSELDRLRTGAAHGTGALGLEDVLAALNEQRVEVVLLEERFAAAGTECPRCGWLGPSGPKECPADGTTLEQRGDVTESALRRAVEQSAGVLVVRDRDDLRPFGGIAAVLRF